MIFRASHLRRLSGSEYKLDKNWGKILAKYVAKTLSPDGRETYESNDLLIKTLFEFAGILKTDKVVDIGCGWGNFTNFCAKFCDNVVGIEPNEQNLQTAINRSKSAKFMQNEAKNCSQKAPTYIQGGFENLNIARESANKIVSMLVFHQVLEKHRQKSLQNISKILKNGGKFIICDVMILFDANKNVALFNEVYRYLLKETTPKDVYLRFIEPYLKDDEIYTLADMKQNNYENSSFYTLYELEILAKSANLRLVKKMEICPFFGIVVFKKS